MSCWREPRGEVERRHKGLSRISCVVLPPVSNEFVTLLKDSALVSILGLPDLTRRGREYVARTFQSFDTYLIVALIYLILTMLFTRVLTAIERRMAVEKR